MDIEELKKLNISFCKKFEWWTWYTDCDSSEFIDVYVISDPVTKLPAIVKDGRQVVVLPEEVGPIQARTILELLWQWDYEGIAYKIVSCVRGCEVLCRIGIGNGDWQVYDPDNPPSDYEADTAWLVSGF